MSYKQPPVRPSQIVEYQIPGRGGSRPMMVVAVHDKFIEGVYWSRGGATNYALSARHVSDPELKDRPILEKDGTWEYSLDSLAIAELREEVARLRDLVLSGPSRHEEPAIEAPSVEVDVDRIVALFSENMSIKDIARATGVHHKRVEKVLREHAKTISAI